MEQKEIQLLVTFSIIVFLLVIVGFVIIFYVFQKRKTQLLIEKAQEKQRYETELAKTQIEIQEQTLKNISWELHDNVGQLLSVAKMQLNMLSTQIEDNNRTRLVELSDVIGKSLQDIRLLSRTLNHEVLHDMGLKKALKLELQRFNRLKFLKATFQVDGEEQDIDDKDEIIIFRIFQEFFSNVMRHSKAQQLDVKLDYNGEKLTVLATDDGIGFNFSNRSKGMGLINMESRSKLINAEYSLTSKLGKGTQIQLVYPYNKSLRDIETEYEI
jgi:hypothetical protein